MCDVGGTPTGQRLLHGEDAGVFKIVVGFAAVGLGLVSAEGGTPLTWGVARTDLSLLISCEISTEASDSASLESVGDSFRSVVVWVVSRVFLRPATCAAAGAVRLAVRGFVVMRGLLSSSLKS